MTSGPILTTTGETTMSAPTIDDAILEALDFTPAVPCELTGHATLCAGDLPAAWLAVGACPGCGRRVRMALCDAGLARKVAADLSGCGSCGHAHWWTRTYVVVPIGGAA